MINLSAIKFSYIFIWSWMLLYNFSLHAYGSMLIPLISLFCKHLSCKLYFVCILQIVLKVRDTRLNLITRIRNVTHLYQKETTMVLCLNKYTLEVRGSLREYVIREVNSSSGGWSVLSTRSVPLKYCLYFNVSN